MLFNLLYLFAMLLLSPWLFWRTIRTGRYRKDLKAKLTGRVAIPANDSLTIWFHGVSVGEVHLLATLVAAYRIRHPSHRIVISSTTDTGLAEARKRFENVIAWPFDFSWAVGSALDSVKPSLVVLAEAEMWPNFLKAANSRGIPVVVVNARLSPRSFQRYLRVARIARILFFNRVEAIAVQGADYAERFLALGVPSAKIIVTGSIKYDGAMRSPEADSPLKKLLNCEPPIWVAGSTHAPEEAIIIDAFAKLRIEFPELKLIVVPRHPDRFDGVAKLIADSGISFVRRSAIVEPLLPMPPLILLDTIGELGFAWSLADVGYVGGTLDGQRGGQSMIEPAGYGIPTVFGPHVWNFKDAAHRLIAAGGAIMIPTANEVPAAIASLLRDPEKRRQMGDAARQFVTDQQGAANRTLDFIDGLLYTQQSRCAA